jgi:hypothetical protein
MLLDVRSALPLTVTASFRPRLKLMWPAGLMTGDVGWSEKERVYSITEESKRFAAVIGCPGARDLSVMPYQEEPKDVPLRFEVAVPPDAMASQYVPIVLAGSVQGRDDAKATYDRVLRTARELFESNAAYYRAQQERTVRVETPDERLDTAFAWAKIGIDKGLVENPLLGTGFVAGFRTSGESERPGFAWHFGRDALWTVPAVLAYGDFDASRAGLEFLRKYQRADGKIPHEVSQSASVVPWFTDYNYPWESADATPLYVIAQAEHWRASVVEPHQRHAHPGFDPELVETAALGIADRTRGGPGRRSLLLRARHAQDLAPIARLSGAASAAGVTRPIVTRSAPTNEASERSASPIPASAASRSGAPHEAAGGASPRANQGSKCTWRTSRQRASRWVLGSRRPISWPSCRIGSE